MRHRLGLPLLSLLLLVPAASADELVDLTHTFDARAIYWPTAKPFQLEVVHKGPTDAGFYYEANRFTADEHGGTHIDAPVHFAKGKWSVAEIPPRVLVGAAILVDITAKAERSADAQLEASDLTAWEKQHGRIPEDAILLVRTGWSRHWGEKKRYLGTDRKGDTANLHFPGIAPAAAEWLVANRRVKMVGIDTPSVDYGPSKDFRTHQILYARNIPGLENVAALERLPPKGATLYALPMKIGGGSGAPCRIFAVVPGGK
jgi:kynurenine formamidase